MSDLRVEDLNAVDCQLVIEQAVKWWEGHRPLKWSVEQHLEVPEVNCGTDADKRLALAAAEVVRQRLGLAQVEPPCEPMNLKPR